MEDIKREYWGCRDGSVVEGTGLSLAEDRAHIVTHGSLWLQFLTQMQNTSVHGKKTALKSPNSMLIFVPFKVTLF